MRDPRYNPGALYQHLKEVQDALDALYKALDRYKGLLLNPGASATDKEIIQILLGKTPSTIDYVEKVITRPGKFVPLSRPLDPINWRDITVPDTVPPDVEVPEE